MSSATGLLAAAEGFTEDEGDGFGVADGDAEGFAEAEGDGFTEAEAEAGGDGFEEDDADGFAEADAEEDGFADGEDDGLDDECGNSGLPPPDDDVAWLGLADGSFDGTEAQAHRRSAHSARNTARTFFIDTPHNRCMMAGQYRPIH